MAPPPLRIGVMLESVQFSDIVGLDILGNLSAAYAREVFVAGLRPDVPAIAPEMEFFYLATTLDLATITPGLRFQPTHTYDNCPRDFDILFIGGPLLTHRPEAANRFMQEAFPRTNVVMTTCVGSVWLASSGVIRGMKATTNREFLPIAKQLYPEVEWLDQRWVIDGKLWTSGGAGAGIDMTGVYCLEHFPPEFVKGAALSVLDFDPSARGQFYWQTDQLGAGVGES